MLDSPGTWFSLFAEALGARKSLSEILAWSWLRSPRRHRSASVVSLGELSLPVPAMQLSGVTIQQAMHHICHGLPFRPAAEARCACISSLQHGAQACVPLSTDAFLKQFLGLCMPYQGLDSATEHCILLLYFLSLFTSRSIVSTEQLQAFAGAAPSAVSGRSASSSSCL